MIFNAGVYYYNFWYLQSIFTFYIHKKIAEISIDVLFIYFKIEHPYAYAAYV